MNKKEYLKYTYELNGKRYWKMATNEMSYEDVFDQIPELAWKIIKDDKKNIGLFSERFLSKHLDMVDYVIENLFETSYQTRTFWSRKYLEAIPYSILRNYYNTIRKWMEIDGRLLALVPYQLQDDYVQIPMEAVKNQPTRICYVSDNALLKYPDICVVSLRDSWDNIQLIPRAVRSKYDFKKLV